LKESIQLVDLLTDHRLAPLAAILTPASLMVEPSIQQTNMTNCSSVRTLNFAPEATKDWRTPILISGLNQLSLSFWNTTSRDENDPNFFDYYDQPSFPIAQIATVSAYLQRAMVRTNAAIDTCGAGWNCSFTVSFTGPGYKCANSSGGAGWPARSTIGCKALPEYFGCPPEGFDLFVVS
jgi:hypothetical protein